MYDVETRVVRRKNSALIALQINHTDTFYGPQCHF